MLKFCSAEFNQILYLRSSTLMLAQIPQCDPDDSSVITERLAELAAQEEACALRRIQIESKRQIEDAKVEQNRKGEDKKYEAILGARTQEDEQRKAFYSVLPDMDLTFSAET